MGNLCKGGIGISTDHSTSTSVSEINPNTDSGSQQSGRCCSHLRATQPRAWRLRLPTALSTGCLNLLGKLKARSAQQPAPRTSNRMHAGSSDPSKASQPTSLSNTTLTEAARQIKKSIFDRVFVANNGVPPAGTRLALFFIGPSCNGKSTVKSGFDPFRYQQLDHQQKLHHDLKHDPEMELADHISKKRLVELVQQYEPGLAQTEEFGRFCSLLPEVIEQKPEKKEDSIQSKLKSLKALKHQLVLKSFTSSGGDIMIDLRSTNRENIRAMRKHLVDQGYTCICISPIVGNIDELKRRWEIRNQAPDHRKDGSDFDRVLDEADSFRKTGYHELESVFGLLLFVVQTDAKTSHFEIVPKDNLKSLGIAADGAPTLQSYEL